MKRILFPILILILASCSQKIIPEKPIPGQYSMPPAEQESAFEIPISIPIDELNQFIEAQIPQKLYTGSAKGTETMTVDMFVGNVNKEYQWEVKYSVYKTGKIELTIDKDGVLWFKIPLKVNAEGCASLNLGTQVKKCGNSSPEINLLVKSKIQIKPDWTFSSKTSIAYELKTAILNIPFQLGNFPLFSLKLNIKDDLQKPMNQQLVNIAAQMDKQIIGYLNSLNIRNEVDKIWNDYTTSISFSEKPPLFINIQPKRLTLSDLYRNKNLIEAKVGIYGVLSLSTKKMDLKKTALPNLDPYISHKGFAVNLPVNVDYTTLSNILMENFADTTFAGNGYKFTAKKIRMYGIGKNLIVEIDYEAKVIGVLKKIVGIMYFKTVPAFDQITNTFYFESCELTTETNSALTNKSLNKFANKSLTKAIINMTRYKLDKDIETLKTQINSNIKDLKLDNLNVKGRIDKIEFVGFYIEPEQLNLYMRGFGVLETKINLLKK